jgi:hypothetical protein
MALVFSPSSNGTSYFRCRKRADNRSCEGGGTLRVEEVEVSVYNQMVQKLKEFQTLTGGDPAKTNPKLTAIKLELAQVEAGIEKLLNTLTGANAVLMSYANSKIEELDAKRQSLMKVIADKTAEAFSPKQLDRISGYLADWDNAVIEDKQFVIDGLISQIQATSESVEIVWKI